MDIKDIIGRINIGSHMLAEGTISEIERDILLEDLRSLYLIAKGNISIKQVPVEQANIAVVEEKPVTPVQPEAVIATVTEHPVVEMVKETPPKEDKKPERTEQVASPEQIKTKPSSLNEIFAGEEKSLNERLSGDKKPALNDQAARKDLKSMIDFNKQYVFTNELFKGDSAAFQSAISRINDSPTIEAAFEYIKTDLLPKYQWNGEMQSARLFDKLVRQKFGV
jgi:hypothetical protein